MHVFWWMNLEDSGYMHFDSSLLWVHLSGDGTMLLCEFTYRVIAPGYYASWFLVASWFLIFLFCIASPVDWRPVTTCSKCYSNAITKLQPCFELIMLRCQIPFSAFSFSNLVLLVSTPLSIFAMAEFTRPLAFTHPNPIVHLILLHIHFACVYHSYEFHL